MFDKFTELARQVLSQARREAERRGWAHIDADLVLLLLLRLPDTTAGALLDDLRVDKPALLARIGLLLPAPAPATSTPMPMPFAERFRAALAAGYDTAARAGTFDTGHLLLGIVAVASGPLRTELDAAGVTPIAVRRAVAAWHGIDLADDGEAIASAPAVAAEDAAIDGAASEPPFRRLTREARRALALARFEAQRLDCVGVDTEHVLMALLRDPAAAVLRLLAAVGIDAGALRGSIESLLVRGAADLMRTPIPCTGAVDAAVELAAAIAERLGPARPGVQHVLVALVYGAEPPLAAALAEAGLDWRRLTAALVAARPRR